MTTTLNLAAVGDLHITKKSVGIWQPIFAQVNERADVLLLAGDLTDYGLPEEAHVLCGELSRTVKIPVVAVLGNHDYESGHAEELCAELTKVGVHCLDGDHFIFDKVLGIAGVKGFCGGFGNATLQAFGEGPIKAFVQEAVSESLKLEAALSQLDTPKKVVIMHYAPIPETCEGENLELHPFLGTSRLAMPVDQFAVQAVFHGHAHHGVPEGKTRAGVPVYNVAMPLLARANPDHRFVVVEV
ncbi:MAG TPA: metallophosphoesterase [Myxococcaceae bacterium]|nr:metallophosphoesterase [Myxococcaceae bacterium]